KRSTRGDPMKPAPPVTRTSVMLRTLPRDGRVKDLHRSARRGFPRVPGHPRVPGRPQRFPEVLVREQPGELRADRLVAPRVDEHGRVAIDLRERAGVRRPPRAATRAAA